MDDLIDELGVTYDELCKLHTGHHLNQESDDNDSSDDSGSLDENLKPPLYTYDELSKNLYIVEEPKQTENGENIKNRSEEIATMLFSCISANNCLICKTVGGSQHYKGPRHYRKVRLWLENELTSSFIKCSFSNFFCEVCNLPLSGNNLAQKHYESEYHNYEAKSFCLICLRRIPEEYMLYHLKSKKHIKKQHTSPPGLPLKNIELRQKALENNETSSLISINHKINIEGQNADTTFKMVQEDPHNGFTNPGLDHRYTVNNANYISSPVQNHSGSKLAEKLRNMLSPDFCYICKKNVNMFIFNHHYVERDHTIKLRSWLKNEIKSSGIKIDPKLLYCEECLLELGGTNEDLKHYKSATHQFNKKIYCSICIFRGTPDTLVEHIANKQHKKNARKLLFTMKNEKSAHPSWPKKLAELISLKECKLCNIKLLTVEEANLHYGLDKHNINVKNWLDYYNQFGHEPSFKKFQCPFCDSIFTSEQELDVHKDFHFPALGGTRDRDSRKKLHAQNANMDNTLKQKQFSTHSQQQSEEKTLIKKQQMEESSCNKKSTKICENIRGEINKLINAIYVSKTLPLDKSLTYLKDLNRKLMDTRSIYKHANILNENNFGSSNNKRDNTPKNKGTGAIKKTVLNASHNDEIMGLEFVNMAVDSGTKVTKHEYAKTKLAMEIDRLKKVLGTDLRISTDLAIKCLQHLNQLLETLSNTGFYQFNINNIFGTLEKELIFSEVANQQCNLDFELNKLTNTLLDTQKINTEEALDFITQFNVQLESFLQYQSN